MRHVCSSVLVLFGVALLACFSSCPTLGLDRDFRQDMRDFVQAIGSYAKGIDADFIIIPQNGHDLVSANGSPDGPPVSAYLGAIDGAGQEDLFYGYTADDVATPAGPQAEMIGFLTIAQVAGAVILVTDYCSTQANVDVSYAQNAASGFVSFAADSRELDTIPSYPDPVHAVNTGDVVCLSDAHNFLYLINPSRSSSKAEFLAALAATDYDLIIMDCFYDDAETYTLAEIASLKTKAGGGSRLVVAYMSIGEAEDYRYYWDEEWSTDPPGWIEEENPDWEGNYKVRYWDPDWQAIIFGNDSSYLKKIIDSGFDGVYLDVIEAFEYFE
jgi:cysteinyl-tRNA synthetase